MYAAPRWTAAATSKAISGVAPALRSNAAGTQQKAGAKRGMAIDKQHTNDGSGQVSPWKSGRGLGAVKRGMPMLPEAGMLIRRAEILLEEECLTVDEFRVAQHSASNVITKEGMVNEERLEMLRQMVKTGMDRKADSANQAQENNPSPLGQVFDQPGFKTAPKSSGTMCVIS
ncbi:hypothetical protein T484DRAFT_1889905 [Baffinella frigidus]|nr:hypothetical protein T484DRAFT_1889905 [Cryptophyta sp. CCMP2293]